MKTTQTLLAAVILSTGLLTASGAHAALESRLGGLAVYDTDLNITWLADANANGLMNWFQANAWASGLTVGGFSGWRLPNTSDNKCAGYNCTGGEMGHLFYNELGGVAGQSITTTHNANLALFQNVQSKANTYWSGTGYAQYSGYAVVFVFDSGFQDAYPEDYNWLALALAVRPGDVAAVPIPASVWLLGSGLFGLAGIAKRKQA